MDKRSTIAELSAKRTNLRAGLDTLLDAAKTEARELTAEEITRFDADEAEIRTADAEIARLDEQIRADEQHAETMKRYGVPRVSVTSEPEVYRKGDAASPSYFRDVYRARNNKPGAREAIERLSRNDKIVQEQRAALSTTNGAGGEFVPPLWLEQDFVSFARPGRIFANLVPSKPLPAGTDSINIPKVNTGTAVAAMTGQNTAVPETDLTTTSVASSVFTIAGGQTVSLQLLEQSPLNVDDVVLQDLAAAYAVALDTYLLTGSGSAGQPQGVMGLSGVNAIDCAAPTTGQTAAGQIYKAVGNAKAQIHSKRYMPAEVGFMTPTRWEWLTTQVDASGRPLVVPASGQGSNLNLLGLAAEVAAQGYMGTFNGLPFYADALIPTNLTADSGTGEDAIIVARISDLVLWESDIRAEAFEQTYAQNMSVFIRLYNYASFQPARHAPSISVITGSGLETPSFA
jgi:HK97 family phage major capsid protein